MPWKSRPMNGTIEMVIFTETSSDDDIPTNDSIYTISDDGTAVLLIHRPQLEEWHSRNGEVYIWSMDEDNHIQELYTMNGTSLNLVMSAPYSGDGEVAGEAENEMIDMVFSFDGVEMTLVDYDELITSNDDYIMHLATFE